MIEVFKTVFSWSSNISLVEGGEFKFISIYVASVTIKMISRMPGPTHHKQETEKVFLKSWTHLFSLYWRTLFEARSQRPPLVLIQNPKCAFFSPSVSWFISLWKSGFYCYCQWGWNDVALGPCRSRPGCACSCPIKTCSCLLSACLSASEFVTLEFNLLSWYSPFKSLPLTLGSMSWPSRAIKPEVHFRFSEESSHFDQERVVTIDYSVPSPSGLLVRWSLCSFQSRAQKYSF